MQAWHTISFHLSNEEIRDFLDVACAYWVHHCLWQRDELVQKTENFERYQAIGLMDNNGIKFLDTEYSRLPEKYKQW